jgi:hypothetical protein
MCEEITEAHAATRRGERKSPTVVGRARERF